MPPRRTGLCAILKPFTGRLPAAASILLLSAAAGRADELLVSSYFSNTVGRYDAATGAFLGALPSSPAISGAQCAVVGPDGRLYVASEGNSSILRYDLATFAAIDTFVPSGNGGLNGPNGLAFDAAGDLLVSSFNTNQVLKFSGQTGAPLGAFVAAGSGGLSGPDNGLVFGPDGNLYVPSFNTNSVLRYDGQTGAFLGAFISPGVGGLSGPRQMSFRTDALYIASTNNRAVLTFHPSSGAPLGTFISGGSVRISGFTWDNAGRFLACNDLGSSVRRYNAATGAFIDTLIAPGVGGMSGPTYLRIVPRPQFTETPQFGAGSTICIAWGDPNRDGLPDLAVGATGAQQVGLFTQAPDHSFAPSTPFGVSNTFAVVWGDLNNDGWPDCVIAGYGQPTSVFLSDGQGGFSRQVLPGSFRTIALAVGDFDNDGDLDIAAGNGILGVNQPNQLYINNGDGTFTARPEFGSGQTDSVAWGDFNNDGFLDLAVGKGGFAGPGQNQLFINNGNGTFTARDEFGAGDTASVSWGDFNNDGYLDLAVGNWGGDHSMLYINRRDGTFSGRPAFGGRDTNSVAWGDYNNDGFLDLATGNGDFTSADQNYLYVNNGDGTFVETPAFGLGSTDALAWADADGDGRLDMAAGNEHSPGINDLYRNTDAGPRFLSLHLVGQRHSRGDGYSNRDGIGARVSVYAQGHLGDPLYLRGYRQLSATGGFTSQSQTDPHFGLPLDAAVDIRIVWPGSAGRHIVQDLLGVSVNQRIAIAETDPCYANCDGSTAPPILNVSDFVCFLNRYAAGDLNANCDGSSTPPLLNVSDFVCFLNLYAAGCS